MKETKDLQRAVADSADDLLSKGVTPTASRVAREVGAATKDVQRELENWAASLAALSPDPGAAVRRERSDAFSADTLQEVARALTPNKLADGAHPTVPAATGSIPELEAELATQTRVLARLRQRAQELDESTSSSGLQKQIRTAESRARLLTESIANGGRLLDQETLRKLREDARGDEEQ
jgi:hypothetical protein